MYNYIGIHKYKNNILLYIIIYIGIHKYKNNYH